MMSYLFMMCFPLLKMNHFFFLRPRSLFDSRSSEGMEEPNTAPRIMLRMLASDRNAAALGAACGMSTRQITRIRRDGSRQNETAHFQPYIEELLRVSPTSIAFLIARLDDATSSAPAAVVIDGGRQMIEWCVKELALWQEFALLPAPPPTNMMQPNDISFTSPAPSPLPNRRSLSRSAHGFSVTNSPGSDLPLWAPNATASPPSLSTRRRDSEHGNSDSGVHFLTPPSPTSYDNQGSWDDSFDYREGLG